ncbi:arsenite methyltransferase [Halobacterium yunchengense]|uniref:arsenite methyltransferase n=1 Tax=Halobacterium yunchengense TaxID=3108497 RepID=UPI00300AED0B
MTDGATGDRSAGDLDAAARRSAVRERYADAATGGCCGSDGPTGGADADCCAGSGADASAIARQVGYSADDVDAAPDGANLGLSCGNPRAIAELEAGEVVLDLGSGGGFDCLLAAREVGPDGRVVGVDMTPEMIDTARENAADADLENVEFRLGEIEHLPVADASVDAVVSNCVVNLSPDKPRVFREAFRVLAPGGRLAVSDLVAVDEIPPAVREDPDAVAACVGGAAAPDALESMLREAGFADVAVTLDGDGSDRGVDHVAPAAIEARKPTDARRH